MSKSINHLGYPRSGEHDDVLAVLQAICDESSSLRGALIAHALALGATESACHLKNMSQKANQGDKSTP